MRSPIVNDGSGTTRPAIRSKTPTPYGTATFDGDNHIVAIQDKFGGSSTYTYNANGQRVRRKINNQETWDIYGIDGELVAEYAANGAVGTPQKEYGYRDGQLLVTASAPGRVNVALSTNGATASAQNYTQDGVFAGYHFYPSSAIDGQRYGHLIAGGGDINGFWRDEHGLPSWLEVNFNGSKTIEEIDVFTTPECPACLNQADPSPTQTFSQYGVTGFEVQYWTGSSWATVPGGSISGNNLVWRKLTFAAITTSKIRVMVTAAATDGVARIAEIEAWGSSSLATNVALSTNGATATAQNYTQDGVFAGYHFYPSSAIDGQRYGHLIAGGGDINGFWRDEHGLPSWLEVNFNGSKTIEEIDVFTTPECPACLNQADPSSTQTFSQYGVTGFEVQYWTGSSWATVPSGSISGNNLVWRKLTFPAITTSKIRVMVTAAATDGVARIAEIEAWTTSPSNNTTINWLVPDHLGTPRIILDQTGSFANVKRHDYLPFGEELPADTGGRKAAMGYVGGNDIRQQFTKKERDFETGLDYFLARYYSSNQGRFISPDDFSGGPDEVFSFASQASSNPTFYSDLTNPQSLNKYQYSYNSPLKYVDPDGHDALYVVNKDTGQTTIVIPVHFTGANATPGLIADIINRAANLDTGGSGVKVEIVATDKPINGVLNTLDLSQGLDYKHYYAGEGANKIGGNKAHINTNGVGQGGAATHETLHFAGLKDRYHEKLGDPKRGRRAKPDKGYENNIMATSGGTKLTAGQIKEARKNGSTKKCTVEKGITKCK